MVWVATVIGWIMNIYATVTVLWVDGPVTVTGMLVLRVVGIFLAPLGARGTRLLLTKAYPTGYAGAILPQ